MKRNLLKATLMAGLLYASPSFAAATLYGLATGNTIFTMSNPSSPSSISGPYAITGVASGQVLVSLDSRPSDGRLYALGYDSTSMMGELYWLQSSGTTYTATAVSGTMASLDLGSTTNASMDFVSSMDNQIRIMGRNGNNYMMDAATGSISSTGTSGFSFGMGDIHIGSGIMAATAFTNNFYGSDASQQVGYDAANNVMVMMDAGSYANGWNYSMNTLHSVGLTAGTAFMPGSGVGMDTWYDTSTHHNWVYVTGTSLLSGGAHLYRYDIDGGITGTLTDMGAIGSGTLNVRDIAFGMQRDSTSAIMGHLVTALTLNMRNLVFFDSYNPNNIRRMVRLSGMTSGQTMVAIDYSSNGMLYGLGYNSGAHNYQLYTIDTATGHVTAVNTTATALNLGSDDGSGNYLNVAFRFIATANNRIRVIGNNGTTNVQLNSMTGAIASNDAAVSYVTGDTNYGSTANLTSIAYTGYQGDATTQAFGFDANTGAMVKFNTDNSTGGFGDATSGYINTDLSLDLVLSLLLHTNTYNNAHMNITYDNASSANIGYMVANYYGDSAVLGNYSVMYDMTGMLTGYDKTTAPSPTRVGSVGGGVPVKDLTMRRTMPTAVNNVVAATDETLVYPNPVINNTKIVLNETPLNDISVEVIDLNGNLMRSYTYAAGTKVLDVDMSRLAVGIYSARVISKGITTHNLKIVKE